MLNLDQLVAMIIELTNVHTPRWVLISEKKRSNECGVPC